MQYKKYKQYIEFLDKANDETTIELIKELNRFDDADKRYAKKMKNIDISEYQDGQTEADIHDYRLRGSDVESQSLINFYAEHLAGALDILPDIQRKIIQYHFYQDLNQCEIAEIEQLHKATVSYMLKSALSKMSEYLDEIKPS